MPQVTLELPESVLDTARRQGLALGLSVEQYLTLQITVWMITGSSGLMGLDPTHFAALSDEGLLSLIHGLTRVTPHRYFDLSFQQFFGGITPEEKAELPQLETESKVSLIIRAYAVQAWKLRHGTLPPGHGSPCCIG